MDDLENEFAREFQSDSESDRESISSMKSPKLPVAKIPIPEKTEKSNGFYESSRLCLERVREAMLHHRWDEAAEYFTCYPQILEDMKWTHKYDLNEVVWRIGIEILHHQPNSKLEDYNNIYERIKQSRVKRYLQTCLEHSFHLLLNNCLEEAKLALSVAQSWRYGKYSMAQYDMTKLIQAYRGLLDYLIWCENKEAGTQNDFSDTSKNQTMHNHFKQAAVNLKEIFKNPGVWDPFILSYVEMLEFYEDHDEAVKVLTNYADDNTFPPNPNAHVYLYQYLKKHNTPAKKLTKVLKVLHVLVPSHKLMTEYCALLLESGKTSKALAVAVDLLDFACWRNNLDVWKILTSIIDELQSQAGWEEVVSEVMSGRKGWWPALHFTTFHAAQDARENPELMRLKAPLSKILCPDQTLSYCADEAAAL